MWRPRPTSRHPEQAPVRRRQLDNSFKSLSRRLNLQRYFAESIRLNRPIVSSQNAACNFAAAALVGDFMPGEREFGIVTKFCLCRHRAENVGDLANGALTQPASIFLLPSGQVQLLDPSGHSVPHTEGIVEVSRLRRSSAQGFSDPSSCWQIAGSSADVGSSERMEGTRK